MSVDLKLIREAEGTENTPPVSPEPKPQRRKKNWYRRLASWGIRVTCILIALPLLYIMFALILGAIPVNTSFQQTPDGIEIAILDNGVHCDIAVPIKTAHLDWHVFLDSHRSGPDSAQYEFALIGWGNRRFYIETRTWADIKLSNSFAALTGLGETVVHVDYLKYLPASSDQCRRIRISTEQYRKLCESLQKSFRQNANQQGFRIPDVSYWNSDAFYEGTGHYHILNTCNVWCGRNLQAAGIQTGWWTPFSFSLFRSLPNEREQTEVF